MDSRTLIPIIVVIVAVIVIAAVIIARKRKTQQLKEHFGPEYERELRQRGDPRLVESELAQREKRVHSLSIRSLSPPDRERFVLEWDTVQRRFVDDPAIAVRDADNLVNRVMGARGYPMSDFEQRAADVSVSYPSVVQNYRAAREIALRHSKGQSSTEDLRQAMVYYRSLFAELLETPKSATTGVTYERAS
jgi:hypothetical protein